MKPIFWALLLCVPLGLPAQNTYFKTVGTSISDLGTSCIPTTDYGSALIFSGAMPAGGVRMGLVKADHNGSVQWSKLFEHGTFAFPKTIIPAADGGFIVFGSVEHPDSAAYRALFLLKTDNQGNEQWSYRLPTSANDRPVGMLACKAGGFLTCSVFNDNSVNGQYPGAQLIRYDDTGNVLWTKQYQGGYGVQPVSVTELPDGDLVFVSSAKFSLAGASYHTLVTRTDAQGNVLWSSFFELEYDDEPYDMVANASGELFISGATYRMGNEWDGFLLKVDAQGKQVFNRFYDAGTAQGENFRCLSVTPQGSVLLLGDMGSFEERDITLLSVNDQGQLQWTKRYPFSPAFTNYPLDMYTSYNGGIVFTGEVRPPAALGEGAMVGAETLVSSRWYKGAACFYVYDVPFTASPRTLTVTSPALPAPDTLTFTHPGQAITEKPVCEKQMPVPLNLWYATEVCPNVCMTFQDSTLNNPTAWLWEFEGATPSTSTQQHPQHICYPEKGTYDVTLTVTNAQGTVTLHKKIVIHEPDCPPPVVPNVFTPNGDGVNDEFLISQLPDEFTFYIYNRWGEVVFQSSEKSKLWKGKNLLGRPVSDGVYFYSLKAYDKDYHGFIHLFR